MFDGSRVACPENPGSMKPAVEWVSNPSRPSDDLPSRRFGLLLGGVDVRVAMVLEHSEEPVKTHVDARRLEHRGIPRLQGDPSLGHLGQDVSVAQKHAPSLMVSGSGLGMSCGEQCGVVVVRPSSRDTFRSDRGLGAHETCSLALQNPLLWLF